mmetsp:Transcript_15654/g.16396  ORF Transcript_15654/g.16396 Transcript_15654/m.16396 type:complete len:334 (+) Transcript_15654:72-1073(+)
MFHLNKKLISKKFLSNSSFKSINSLVIAEHDNNKLTQGTLACITAAQKLGGNISLLIGGSNINNVINSATKVIGPNKILTVNSGALDNSNAENYAKLLHKLAPGYTHILAPSSNTGKNFIPRLGALLNVSPLTDILAVVNENTFKRPTYAGSAITTVQMEDPIKLILTRSTAFDKAPTEGGSVPTEAVNLSDEELNANLSSFVSESVSQSARPELTSAPIVISGGRGMKSGENFQLLEKLADKLGGAVGASRAAVDAGFAAHELQIGQTGKVVAPNLYVAVGISGAIQHLSGMKDSKVIVAINKDKDAPIFQVADYGIVDDLFKVIPEVTEKV